MEEKNLVTPEVRLQRQKYEDHGVGEDGKAW